ncbi:transmembrane protein, putative (macronuclear) [Tetrahymena thermophila SB210]|uniref:Transmembrane protein, putative n=1 Tax=Tetrahymena thermophila (strain SB210) TaxID=312017 RepID=Q23AL3_TETTS|nr:transmembrane protein, putative [Tetrahymena thermophila SB210]EAR93479.2 transmembrane protein, putative [Tetrahymena thermophila SB210]|eukprot:XP_001013724.2 transmembrane protein, putative [Tetrahymena thermophila SB210]
MGFISLILIFLSILLPNFKCGDQLPIEIKSDVLYIEEFQSLIYQSKSDSKWRYSTLDSSGNIQQTIIINNFGQTITKDTTYFVEQDKIIYILTFGESTYSVIDTSKLNIDPDGSYKSQEMSPTQCDIKQTIIMKQKSLYLLICFEKLNSFFVTDTSFLGLFSSKQITSTNKGMRNEQQFFYYDGFIFLQGQKYQIKFIDKKTIDILVVNQDFNLYLVEYQLSLFSFSDQVMTQTKRVSLGATSENILMSKIISFTNMFVIFAYNQDTNKFEFFNAQTLQKIQQIGENMIYIDYQSFIQRDKDVFIGKNWYKIDYDSNQKQILVQLIRSDLPYSYQLRYKPFQSYNFNNNNIIECQIDSKNYLTDINFMYGLCTDGCKDCKTDTSCQNCQKGSFLDFNQKCVQSCPTTYKQDNIKNICVCDKDRVESKNHTCDCKDGFYLKNQNCEKCSANCLKCSDSQECQKCSDGYFLQFDKTCQKICPPDQQQDKANQTCKCDQNAQLSLGQCKCNDGFYMNGNQCVVCKENCATCNDGDNCVKYKECNSFQIFDPNQKQCICKEGYYTNGKDCSPCQEDCLICYDSKTCLKQKECGEMQKYDNQLKKCTKCLWDTDKKICVEECQPEQYKDTVKLICIKCDNQQKGNCVVNCPLKQYYDYEIQKCLPCHSSCNRCKGKKENQCINCVSPLILQPDSTCSHCEQGQFLDEKTKICEQCYYKCKQCKGKSEDDCISCVQDFVLSSTNQKCITKNEASEEDTLSKKLEYSECQDSSSFDCQTQQNFLDLFQSLHQIMFFAFLPLSVLCLLFVPNIRQQIFYFIQVQQIVGNFIMDKRLNLLWLNVGFLKVQYGFNILNIISFLNQQKKEEIVYDLNQFDIGINVQNLSLKFLDNCLIQIVILAILLICMIVVFFLKSESRLMTEIKTYFNINFLIRYFMICSNQLFLSALICLKEKQILKQNNIYFILPFLLIYIVQLLYSIYILLFSNSFALIDSVQVLRISSEQSQKMQNFFWIFFEFKKLSSLILIYLFQDNLYATFIIPALNLIFLIYFIAFKPFQNSIQDKLGCLIEFISIILISCLAAISNREKLGISNNHALNFEIVFVSFSLALLAQQIIVCCLYFFNSIKNYFINRRNQQIQNAKLQNIPLTSSFQMIESINNIQSILSSTKFSKIILKKNVYK